MIHHTTEQTVAHQSRSCGNVLRRALDELDVLSLQLSADASSSDNAANSQSSQLELLQSRLRNRAEATMRNVCDRLGLSPPGSPSLMRRTNTLPTTVATGSRRQSHIVRHSKLISVRSLALEILDLEIGVRGRGAKTTAVSRYQRSDSDNPYTKFLPFESHHATSATGTSTNTQLGYTPLSDRRSRKRIERSKRLRKPYDLPWRAQKSATLNTLVSDTHANANANASSSTSAAASVGATECGSPNAYNTHARRVSAPSVLDTDDECATPTQTHPSATESHAHAQDRHGGNSSTMGPLSLVPVAPFTADGMRMDSRTESLMIADGDAADELTETQTETSGVHSLGLLSTATPVCNAFAGYADVANGNGATQNNASHLVSTRSQSNSVNSECSAVSAIALAQTNMSSQCLLRSRSLDTVGIASVSASTADAAGSAYHAAAHAHFHSSHASYVSQAHSPHANITLGSDSLPLASQPPVYAAVASQISNAFAYPAEPHPSNSAQQLVNRTVFTATAQGQQSAAVRSVLPQTLSNAAGVQPPPHTYAYWRTGSVGQAQTSAGVLNSSTAWHSPAASHSQQAALQKYGVEDMVAHSLRHLRLNDR